MKQRAAAPGNHHAGPATRCNGGAAPQHRALLVPSAPQSREAMKYLKCTWGEVGGEGAGTGQGRRYQDLTALCTGSGGVSGDRLCPTCDGAVTTATLPQPSSTACSSCLLKNPLCLGLWVLNTPSLPLQHTLWGRALTFPGLALPDQEGPAVVARSEQQLLCLLPADALVQPPGWAVGVGRAVPRWLPEQGGSTSRPGDGDRWGGPTAKPVGCRAQHLASILCSVRCGDAGPGHPARLATSPSSAPRLSVSNGTSGPGTVAGVWPQGQSLLL